MFDSRQFEFADIQVTLLGFPCKGLRGLKYKKAQEKEAVFGAGNQPGAIQRGNKTYDGTLTLLKDDVDVLNRAAKAAGYEDITDVPYSQISITCVYEQIAGGKLSSDTLIGVEFTEIEEGLMQNDKFSEVALPFIFLRLKKA